MKILRNFANYFGFYKFQRLYRDIKNHGGLIPAIGKLRRFDEMKSGRLVGEDKYGNKYYENLYYFFGRSRWVEYPEYKNCDMNRRTTICERINDAGETQVDTWP